MKKIKSFICPDWENLPNNGLRSKETIEYIESVLENIIIDRPILTATMIQNYRKWGLLTKQEGRMYYREDIARLIVISTYKQVLPIDSVKKGIRLNLLLMSIEKSYNTFSKVLTKAIQDTINSIDKEGNFNIDSIKIKNDELGISIIAYAYSSLLLGNLIIRENGIKNIRRKLNE